jgi:hypothetical protein
MRPESLENGQEQLPGFSYKQGAKKISKDLTETYKDTHPNFILAFVRVILTCLIHKIRTNKYFIYELVMLPIVLRLVFCLFWLSFPFL